jgi:hypothetical protein
VELSTTAWQSKSTLSASRWTCCATCAPRHSLYSPPRARCALGARGSRRHRGVLPASRSRPSASALRSCGPRPRRGSARTLRCCGASRCAPRRYSSRTPGDTLSTTWLRPSRRARHTETQRRSPTGSTSRSTRSGRRICGRTSGGRRRSASRSAASARRSPSSLRGMIRSRSRAGTRGPGETPPSARWRGGSRHWVLRSAACTTIKTRARRRERTGHCALTCLRNSRPCPPRLLLPPPPTEQLVPLRALRRLDHRRAARRADAAARLVRLCPHAARTL